MADSFTFDGNDQADNSLTVLNYRFPSAFAAITDVQDPVFGPTVMSHNGIAHGVVEIDCIVTGATEAAMWTNMDAVTLETNARGGNGNLTIDGVPDRYWRGIRNGEVIPRRRGARAFEFTIRFMVEKFAYSTTETTAATALTGSPQNVNVPAAGVVAGSAETFPEFYVRNTTGGNVTTVTITNSTITGSDSVTWNGLLLAGFWLKFGKRDSGGTGIFIATIEKSTTANPDYTAPTYTDVINQLSAGSPTVRLVPGVQNVIAVAGITAGSFVPVYRARYGG